VLAAFGNEKRKMRIEKGVGRVDLVIGRRSRLVGGEQLNNCLIE
jgi:hypothetical protein